MKKIIALLLVCCALLGLVACGNTDKEPTGNTTESTQQEETTPNNNENDTTHTDSDTTKPSEPSDTKPSGDSDNDNQQGTHSQTGTPTAPEINRDPIPNVIPNIPDVKVEESKAVKGDATFTVIPEGGTYKTADGKTLSAGEPFPTAPASGDTFFYNGFKYVQGGFILNGTFSPRFKNTWFVYANKSGIENLDNACSKINGQQVNLRTASDLDF